jgi:hypothetical protein
MRWDQLWVAACVCSMTGCFSVNTGDPDDAAASLHIDAASVSTTTVADGDSFEFSWKVSHTKQTGYVTQVGLYVGSEGELATASERDRRALFSRAVTAGVQNDAAESTISCIRSGSALSCGGSTHDAPAGEAELTFRACTSYVLSSEETCEFRAFTLSLP